MANEKWRIRTGSRRMEIDGVAVSDVTAVKLNAIPAAAESGFITGVTAGTAAASKAMVTSASGGIAGNWVDRRSTAMFKQAAPATATASETLTAAKLLTGIILGTPGAAVAYTLPLATDFETALLALYPGLANDDAIDFSVVNLGADTFTITMTTNTGWTLSGNMVVHENNPATNPSTGVFRARRTGANAYTLYRVG